MKILVISCFMVLLTTSCGKLDDFEKKSTKMAKTSDKLHDLSGNALDLQRKGGSSISRLEYLKMMNEEKNFIGKSEFASKYMKAFEFQSWLGNHIDSHKERERMLDEAVIEFCRRLASYYYETGFNEFSPTTNNNDELNIFALSVASHQLDATQEKVLKRNPKLKEFSIYNMIKTAFLEIKDASQEMSNLSSEMMVYERELRHFLNSRYNMLIAMSMTKVSKVSELSTISKAWKRYITGWDNEFDSLNESQRERVLKYLDGAVKLKKFMNSLGEDLKLHSKIKGYYKKSKFSDKNKCLNCEDLKTYRAYLGEVLE